MKSTNSTRRIDQLGRVVIPKEIREKLNLKTGSAVKIFEEGQKIIIENHSKLDYFLEMSKVVSKSFEKFDVECFVCNMQTILFKTANFILNNNLFDFLAERKNIILHGEKLLGLLKNSQTEGIFPIVSNGDVCGGICVISKKFVDNFDFVLPVQKLFCDYLNIWI